jgi:hypothetical protein
LQDNEDKMKEKSDWKELNQLKEYLLNPGTESAKDYLVFSLSHLHWHRGHLYA